MGFWTKSYFKKQEGTVEKEINGMNRKPGEMQESIGPEGELGGTMPLLLSAEDYRLITFQFEQKRFYSTEKIEAEPIYSRFLNAKQRIQPHKGCPKIWKD